MLRKIELKTFEDVKKLNAFAMTCPYDTFVHSGNDVVDAKSLMGILSIGLDHECVAELHSNDDEKLNNKFEKDMKLWIVKEMDGE